MAFAYYSISIRAEWMFFIRLLICFGGLFGRNRLKAQGGQWWEPGFGLPFPIPRHAANPHPPA